MNIEIVPAELEHCYLLADDMRPQDAIELARLGQNRTNGVLGSFRAAQISRTGLVDGEVAAMWGVTPIPDGAGRPWFLTSRVCCRAPTTAIARIYREQVAEFATMFPRLENYVDASYDAAVRLIILAGFTVDEPVPFGLGGAPFRKFHLGV